MKKHIILVLCIVLGVVGCIQGVMAKKKNIVTKYDVVKELVVAAEDEKKPASQQEVTDAAIRMNITTKEELNAMNQPVRLADVAGMICKAYEYRHGKKSDTGLYENIKRYHRIADESKVEKSKRKQLRKCYAYGIVTGKSAGDYSGKRILKPQEYITRPLLKHIVLCIKNQNQCASLTQDGQVIRTYHLPKNYKKYPYILEGVPNEYYEKPFRYQNTAYHYQPTEGVDYMSPVRMDADEYRFIWTDKVLKNLRLRLRASSQNCNHHWISELRNTYTSQNRKHDNLTSVLEDYVDRVKDEQTFFHNVRIYADPGSVYFCSNMYFVRCYVELTVETKGNIPSAESLEQKNLLFAKDYIQIKNWKKNQTIHGIVDIGMGGTAYGEDKADYSIVDDNITIGFADASH
ncbi:MAG: hypothetical protein ACI4CT_03550 [Lachnospiraceae bacterium]